MCVCYLFYLFLWYLYLLISNPSYMFTATDELLQKHLSPLLLLHLSCFLFHSKEFPLECHIFPSPIYGITNHTSMSSRILLCYGAEDMTQLEEEK